MGSSNILTYLGTEPVFRFMSEIVTSGISKFEILLFAHNWHWVSTVKYGHRCYDRHFWNSSCDECKCQKQKLFPTFLISLTVSKNIIIYFFSEIKTVGCRSFFTKNRTIFIVLYFGTYQKFKALSRFCNKYKLCNISRVWE